LFRCRTTSPALDELLFRSRRTFCPPTGLKILKIPLEWEYFYFVEYRKAIGLDGASGVSTSYSETNANPIAFYRIRRL